MSFSLAGPAVATAARTVPMLLRGTTLLAMAQTVGVVLSAGLLAAAYRSPMTKPGLPWRPANGPRDRRQRHEAMQSLVLGTGIYRELQELFSTPKTRCAAIGSSDRLTSNCRPSDDPPRVATTRPSFLNEVVLPGPGNWIGRDSRITRSGEFSWPTQSGRRNPKEHPNVSEQYQSHAPSAQRSSRPARSSSASPSKRLAPSRSRGRSYSVGKNIDKGGHWVAGKLGDRLGNRLIRLHRARMTASTRKSARVLSARSMNSFAVANSTGPRKRLRMRTLRPTFSPSTSTISCPRNTPTPAPFTGGGAFRLSGRRPEGQLAQTSERRTHHGSTPTTCPMAPLGHRRSHHGGRAVWRRRPRKSRKYGAFCGADCDGVELHARAYKCEACGQLGVFGAEELVLMTA